MPVKLRGVGIDLVSVERARKLLQDHRSKVFQRLLTSSERKKFRARGLSPKVFAKWFAAKEAFFKAVGDSWMGLEGFGAIEIKGFARDRFQVQSHSLIGRSWKKAEGRFFETKEFVGAQVVVLQEETTSRRRLKWKQA